MLGVAGEFLFLSAIKETDFSLIMPLLALIPLFSALFGFALFGEVPTMWAGVGILLVISGTYLLGIRLPLSKNLASPFAHLLSDSGCRKALLFALVATIGLVGQRYAARYTSPQMFLTLLIIFNWIAFVCVSATKQWRGLKELRSHLSITIVTGVLWTIGVNLLFLSFNYTLAAYASSVFQVQTIVSITIGALFFQERAYLQRLCAGALIAGGVALVCLLGR